MSTIRELNELTNELFNYLPLNQRLENIKEIIGNGNKLILPLSLNDLNNKEVLKFLKENKDSIKLQLVLSLNDLNKETFKFLNKYIKLIDDIYIFDGYNYISLRRAIRDNIELSIDIQEKILKNSDLFRIYDKILREEYNEIEKEENFEVREEIKKCIGKFGIIDLLKLLLFDDEKLARKIVEYFESKREIENLKKFIKEEMEKLPNAIKQTVKYCDYEMEFREILDMVGITIDAQNFLRKDGKEIALVNDDKIIPLENIEETKKILNEIDTLAEIYNLDKKPFLKAFDNITNYTLKDIEEQEREEKERRELEIESAILDELPNVKVERKFLYKRVSLNPGYEVFFYDILGGYSIGEILNVLKKLENEMKEKHPNSYEKIKALKEEFERREGIRKKKMLGLLIGGLLSTTAFVTAYQLSQPKISNVEVKKMEPGKYLVSAKIDGNSLKAYLVFNGTQIPLNFENGNYKATISVLDNSTFKIVAQNIFGSTSQTEGKINITQSDKLEYLLYLKSNLFKELYSKSPDVASNFLKIAAINSSLTNNLAYIILNQIEKDPRIPSSDKVKTASLASKLFLDLGLCGKVKVLDPKTGNYVDQYLTLPTIQAFGNYSYAIVKGLPLHSRNDLFLLGNATQINPEIVDFEPIKIKDVEGRITIIQSQDLARDYWIIVNLLKERPNLVSQPQKYEWINRMIQEVAWCIFDNPYGPGYFDKKTYNPNDPEVWQVILSFHDYMDDLPARLVKDGIGIIVPYNNSTEMKNFIADKTNRTIALFYLADLPAVTVNKTYARELYTLAQERKITSAEYDKLYNEKAIVRGIKGMKLFVEQLPKEYEELIDALNNSTIVPHPFFHGTKRQWVNIYYQQWLNDRAGHGLPNTVEQFRQIDKFLPEIVKFIYGYERFISSDWGGEWEMYRYGLPIAFKALGIPAGAPRGTYLLGLSINPDSALINAGAPTVEWSVVLPDNIVNTLKNSSPIIIGYGNYFGLFSCKDGLTKDSAGVNTIYQKIRDQEIYLWKKK